MPDNFFDFSDFLNDEYSKHLRKFPGISSINDDIYQAYLESHTTIKGKALEKGIILLFECTNYKSKFAYEISPFRAQLPDGQISPSEK